MLDKEQLRMKVFPDRMVIGVIGRATFNNPYLMHEILGDKNGRLYNAEPSTSTKIADAFGYKLAKSYLDGIGNPHTQIFTLTGEL